jgi:hypothetical protein
VATDVRNAVKTLFIIVVAGVLGLPLLILTIGLARRGRRRRVNDRQPGGLEVSSPATPPTDLDAQRQAAEKAFGTDDS